MYVNNLSCVKTMHAYTFKAVQNKNKNRRKGKPKTLLVIKKLVGRLKNENEEKKSMI